MPPRARAIAGVRDSKKLAPRERERLAPLICSRALGCALGAASVAEIERLNIAGATALAMRRALARLGVEYDVVLVDGLPVRALGVAHRAVVGGDALCYSVACASVVAKVARDRLMAALARRRPQYGWGSNAGYGTAAHLAAMREHGLTPHHRRLFCATALGAAPARGGSRRVAAAGRGQPTGSRTFGGSSAPPLPGPPVVVW